MNNSKMVNVLRTFSKSEMKEFEKLVSSQFFNRGRNYLPFLKQLEKFYPEFEDKKLTYEYIFSKLYPGKTFNKQIIWNMNSALLDMAEEFLIHNALKRNKFVRKHQIAEEYHNRKLVSYLSKTIDEMEKELDHFGIEDDYFLFKIQLAILRKAHNFQQDRQDLNSEHTMKIGEYTILYFMKNIAGFVVDAKAQSVYFNADFEINVPFEFLQQADIEKVINYCKDNNYYYSWIMEMYYCMIMTVLDFENTQYFFRLKELFEKNYDKFRHEVKYNWIVRLTNYCIMKIEKGIDFRRYLHEMNELNLKTGIVFPGKYLQKIIFLRILRNALSVNENGWAEKYINEYVPKLKPSHQKPIRTLANAILFFNLKDYNKVIENLSKTDFIDARDKLYAKTLYIKTYYELNEIETMLLHIDSTKHFLKSNSYISEITRKNCNDFLGCINKLINSKNRKDEAGEIMKKIEKNRGSEYYEWLYEKTEEIIKQ